MKIQIFSRQLFLFKIKIGKRISVYFVCVRDLWLLTKLVVNHSAMTLQIRRNYVQHTTVLIIVLIKSHNLFVRVLLSPVIPTILWWTLVDGVPYTLRLNNVTKQIIMRIIANYKCAYDMQQVFHLSIARMPIHTILYEFERFSSLIWQLIVFGFRFYFGCFAWINFW